VLGVLVHELLPALRRETSRLFFSFSLLGVGLNGLFLVGTVHLPTAPSQFKFVVLRESDKRILRWEAFPGNRVVTPGALDLVGYANSSCDRMTVAA
jgi:hypothetical protein